MRTNFIVGLAALFLCLICPAQALAEVKIIGAWAVNSGAPNVASGNRNYLATTNNVTAGTSTTGLADRMFIVAVALETTAAQTMTTLTATFNGVNMTAITNTTVSATVHTKLFYLLESQIPTGARTLNVAWTGTNAVSALHIRYATYEGVSQAAPPAGSFASNTAAAAAAVTFGTAVSYVKDGLSLFVTNNTSPNLGISVNVTNAGTLFANGSGVNEQENGNGLYSQVNATTAIHSAAGSLPNNTTLTYVGAANGCAVSAVSLRPSCTTANPTVTLTPATATISTPTATQSYTITVTNNDTGGAYCPNVPFTLTANNTGGTNPGGFSTAVTGSPLTLASGAQNTASLDVSRVTATTGQTIINTVTAAATGHTNVTSGNATTTYTPDNRTIVGAMSYSGVTKNGMSVTVAFNGDVNGNNTCSLQAYSDAGRTVPFGAAISMTRAPAAATSGPGTFSAPVSGLSEDTTYYFRATFTDADGYTAGSTVDGSNGTLPSPLMHKGANLGDKYGTWGAAYKCSTCHEKMPASGNIKRIRDQVDGTGAALRATDARGSETAGYGSEGAGNKVCDACHTLTSVYKAGVANSGAVHPAVATNATAIDCIKCHEHRKGFKVNAGCVSCHAANVAVGVFQVASGAPTVVNTTGVAVRGTETYGGHLRLAKGENLATVTDWDKRCLACHDGHYDATAGVMIPNNLTVGIDYGSKYKNGAYLAPTGIQLGGTATSGSTEAEICWNCHDQNSDGVLREADGDVSEWEGNSNTTTNSSPYNYGLLSAKSWTTATWQSSRIQYAYKTGVIRSTHTANPDVTDAPLSGAAYGYTETPNAVADIRCSYCHDVHDTANLKGTVAGDVHGQPYLRGSWRGNPYEEDGAPRRSYANATYFANLNPGIVNPIDTGENTAGWGAVPRGSVSQAMLGGYWIDQNNVTPMSATTTAGSGTAAKNPTTGWTTTQFAGLCALCHGGADKVFDITATVANEIDSLDQTTGEGLWMGANGHANSVIGGRGSAGANETNVYDARGGVAGFTLNPYAAYQGYTGLPADNGTLSNDGFRSANTGALRYAPLLAAGNTRPAMAGVNEWVVNRTGATTDNQYHKFSCSKCHNPHASRLPKLMITNCLDTKHNTWDNQFQLSAVGTNNTNMEVANWTSAQNCHRYAANNPNAGNTQENDNTTTVTVPVSGIGAGWNKVTPWTSTTNTE